MLLAGKSRKHSLISVPVYTVWVTTIVRSSAICRVMITTRKKILWGGALAGQQQANLSRLSLKLWTQKKGRDIMSNVTNQESTRVMMHKLL